VIGVNSQIASSGSSAGGESGNVGIGFAIPSNTVEAFIAHPTSTQSTQPEQTQVDPNQLQIPDGGQQQDPYGGLAQAPDGSLVIVP